MAREQTETNGKKHYDFTPVDGFDGTTIEPDAAPGEYQAKITDVTARPTNNDRFPMLVVSWKLLKAEGDDDSQANSVGATVADFIVFYPPKHRAEKMGKMKYRALCGLLDIPLDTVPSSLRSNADFDDFIRALKGRTASIWITNKEDKSTGEIRVNIQYTAPKGLGGGLSSRNDDDEDDDGPAVTASKKPAAKKRR